MHTGNTAAMVVAESTCDSPLASITAPEPNHRRLEGGRRAPIEVEMQPQWKRNCEVALGMDCVSLATLTGEWISVGVNTKDSVECITQGSRIAGEGLGSRLQKVGESAQARKKPDRRPPVGCRIMTATMTLTSWYPRQITSSCHHTQQELSLKSGNT